MKEILCTEWKKYRHCYLLLTVFLCCAAEVFWITQSIHNYLDKNSVDSFYGIAQANFATLNCLFMPILFAVLASRICDLEVKGHTYTLLLTHIKASSLYSSKAISMVIFSFLVPLVQIGYLQIYSNLKNSIFPIAYWQLYHFLGVFAMNFAISMLCLWFMITFENQLHAMILGLAAGFLGFLSQLFPDYISRFFLWSYYYRILPFTITYTEHDMLIKYKDFPFFLSFLLFIVGLIFYFLGKRNFTQRDF